MTLSQQVGVLALVAYGASLVRLAFPISEHWGRVGLRSCFLGLAAAIVLTALISEQLLTFNAGYVLVLLVSLGPSRTTAWSPSSWRPSGAFVARASGLVRRNPSPPEHPASQLPTRS